MTFFKALRLLQRKRGLVFCTVSLPQEHPSKVKLYEEIASGHAGSLQKEKTEFSPAGRRRPRRLYLGGSGPIAG